jgi:clan AA aspartic protease (TIGR02281 family)
MRIVAVLFRKFLALMILIALGGLPMRAQADVSLQDEIPLEKMSGVYHLPVELNGVVTLMFILDTGAAEMSLPQEVVQALIQGGTIGRDDFIESKVYVLADGTRVKSPRVIIHKVKIGNRVLHNVEATITDEGSALLLGQNLLEKIGSYTFDGNRQVLVLHSETNSPQGAPIPPAEQTPTQRIAPLTQQLNDTETVVEQFFLSIAEEKFADSWKMLSTYSQDTIVNMVAEEAEKPPDLIRTLFDTNHRSVQSGFWNSFRSSSQIPILLPRAIYHQTHRTGDFATVMVRVGEEEIRFELYEEKGSWKLGLIESIERFRSLKKN